jgi:hypothetical protein
VPWVSAEVIAQADEPRRLADRAFEASGHDLQSLGSGADVAFGKVNGCGALVFVERQSFWSRNPRIEG